jgi:hypothetical protein
VGHRSANTGGEFSMIALQSFIVVEQALVAFLFGCRSSLVDFFPFFILNKPLPSMTLFPKPKTSPETMYSLLNQNKEP